MIQNHRDHSIDSLRGMAIFIMIFANAAPYILPEPHSFWVRSIDSYAAPIFISLAGFGISLGLKNVEASIFNKKLFFRGLLTILTAALIDCFTWGIMPFVGFDVLYLIGFSLVCASFFGKIPNYGLLFLMAIVILLAVYFQMNGFYKNEIEDVKFKSENFKYFFNHFDAFITYGWFPVFPWLAVFSLGYFGGKLKPRFGRYKLIFSLVLIVIFSITLTLILHQNKITRDGYSELFYPADYLFLIHIFALLTLIWINRKLFSSKLFSLFRVLGKCSLFIYILHSFIISKFLVGIHELSDKKYWATYLIFYLIIYAIAFLLDYIKQATSWKKTPYIVRFLFGS